MTLSYRVVDVFTERAYAGNPLAVVLGADDLSTEQCQAVAAEFNLSETAFPMQTTSDADYRLRIFTPAAELPFAGHPSVGAAWVQRDVGAVSADRVVQECGAGLLPLGWRADGSIELTGGVPTVGDPLPEQRVTGLLEAAGLPPFAAAVDLSARWASTGNAFTIVPVDEAALTRARPSAAVADALVDTGGHGLYLVAWTPAMGRAASGAPVPVGRAASGAPVGHAHVRMFAPGLGVSEDPATGSAATALGAWLALEGLVDDGETAFTVSQGAEMGRPSTLHATVVVASGIATECRVAGHVVPVARGELTVPPTS